MKKSFLLGILFVSIILLISVGCVFDKQSRSDVSPSLSEYEPHIEVSFDEQDVSLVGGVVEEWMKWDISATDLYDKYRDEGRIYAARTVVINWGIFDIPEGTFISELCFELAEDKDFKNVDRYDLNVGERRIELYNLFVDTEYYFRILMKLDNEDEYTAEGNFTTSWSPRIIEFENLRNIRDIGGWKTVNGEKIKQGLVYRGCELDGATSEKYLITQAGLNTLLNDFNIKTELDLRSSNLEGVKDMLGPGVSHQNISFLAYSDAFTDYGSDKLRQVFVALSKEENYPMYIHCAYGADRTGTVCYLLEALLGMSEEDCYREWELSILTNGGAFYEEMDEFLNSLHGMEGDTLQEKVEKYLLSIGVTESEIQNIKNILIEDYSSGNTDTD